MESSEDDGLYSPKDTTRLIFFWCLVWLAVHHLAWPVWKRRRVLALILNPTPVERYRRRLCRSQVYCAVAVVAGIRLLMGCRWSAEDLLYAYSAEHQIFFSMAAGHWIIAIWEDRKNWTFLRGGLTVQDTVSFLDLREGSDPSSFLWQAYLLHHTVAAVAFIAAMRMKVCTGLAAFGLVFEMPVLYMNHREFAVCADTMPQWFKDVRQVEAFWISLRLWFKVARGVPSAVYLYSIFFWREELSKLSTKEALTYHVMAIFFTVLNVFLSETFLYAWEKKDLELASSASSKAEEDLEEKFRLLLRPEEEAKTPQKPRQEDDSSAEDVPEVAKKQLDSVTAEMFTNKAKSEDGALWVEIDKVAYDLTEFLGKHPGGDPILRQFAFKDASKAFHKAKHSMKAKMQMQTYCIGPMVQEIKEYRIFEHTQELQEMFWEFRSLAIVLALACWIFPQSFLVHVRPLSEDAGPAARLLAPGLALTAGSSMLLLGPGFRRLSPAKWTPGAMAFAAAFSAFMVGLGLACQPLRAASLPSGLEIGGVLIFVTEEVMLLTQAEGYRHFFWRRLTMALVFMLLSWWLRDASLDMFYTDTEHALGGVLLGLSIPCVSRLVTAQDEQVLLDRCLNGLAIAALFSSMTLSYMLVPTADRAGLRELANHAWTTWNAYELTTALVSCSASLGSLSIILNQSFGFSAKWASRMTALILSMAVGLYGGLLHWRWLGWVAWFTLTGTLGLRNNAGLDEMQKRGKLGEAPTHRISARAALEMWYLLLGNILWQASLAVLKNLINMLMPKELQFYAPWLPFFKLGEDVDIGVAAYHATKEGVQSEVGPRHFVISVRHMDTAHPDGQRDLQLHRNTAQDMWTKCKDTSSGGLIANVNCFFPHLSGSTHCKEINLSGWTSEEAAKAWSAKNSGLPGMQSHRSSRGQMRTLGSMQAFLKTHGEIRHQDRCSNCARLLESQTLGEKAPDKCRYCGKPGYGYPFF